MHFLAVKFTDPSGFQNCQFPFLFWKHHHAFFCPYSSAPLYTAAGHREPPLKAVKRPESPQLSICPLMT